MRVRYLTVAALVVVGVLAPVATTAATAAVRNKPVVTHTEHATKPKPVKPVKPVKFAASGTVSAVNGDARTITVAVRGGTSDLRGTTTTFSVAATARVTVNDTSAALADVHAGDKVAVQGDKAGSVYTAARVNASAPRPQPSTTPEPSQAS